jgi:UDPglucose--hexose-1-phosphate uridylyltransferase
MPTSQNQNSAPFGAENQLRKHYFLDRYVIISPSRKMRPVSFKSKESKHKSTLKSCVLCIGNNEKPLYRLPATGQWQVKAINNKYPALSHDNPEAYGNHELIIETPDHNREFSELTHAEKLDVFSAYQHRLNALTIKEGIRYVQVWKNDGPLAGASIAHAHSQILALPLIPPQAEVESIALNSYRNMNGTCAICDLIVWEESQDVRVVYQDKYIIALCPYASSAPFGVWIIPKRHETSFSNLKPDELNSLATILGKISSKLDSESISFNWFLVNSLPHEGHHFVFKVEPRDTTWGGAELGTGIVINPIPPEYSKLWYQGKEKP